jgi:hypothetical protein
MEFTMAEKKKIAAQFASRCRKAAKCEKPRILDEYPALSGSKNRKHAIFKLNRIGKTQLRMMDNQAVTVVAVEKNRKKRVCQPCYDAEAAALLKSLWKNFNRPCGKLFAPFLRQNLDLIRLREKHRMSDAAAAKLKKISPRSINRLLGNPKQQMKIRSASDATPVRLLHRAVPIRTWLQYAQKPSGFFQIDPVQHDGGNPSGEFCYTLTMTTVKTGWTVHFALILGGKGLGQDLYGPSHGIAGHPFRHRRRIYQQTRRPLAPRHGVRFSRGRPTHKNDNCYVEQKNYATVRKIVGYFRYEGPAGVAALQAVYDAYNPLLNLYYPCMKQISCTRVGAKKIRRYDEAKTPFQRLLEQPFEDKLEERRVKMAALALKDTTALVEQKQQMDQAVDTLIASAHAVPVIPRRGTNRHG